jgi:ABC-type lipoprotein export system ATPase subunit
MLFEVIATYQSSSMQIELKEVLPVFFSKQDAALSQVWCKNITFNNSDYVHIVSPSGTGKTSLIHFLYGLRNDYTGDIFYGGQNIKNFDSEKFSKWRQEHISIVFQDLRLFTSHTVFQNLQIKRLLQPYHGEEKIVTMARRLGVENKLDKICKTCSYGEQQRIAIIRALLQPFDFLLLDEPFSHLDEANRVKAMELIQDEAAARNASIILADLKKIEYFHGEKELVV